jgi:uncharacterized protein (DUF2336 family)
MAEPQGQRKLLEKFDAVARRGADASKDDVLDLLVDLFAARGEGMSAATLDSCLDLLFVASSWATAPARTKALARLVHLPATPSSRLLAWAAGPIETAEPVLRHARHLTSADLLRVLVEASPAHLRAAASRSELPESVTDLILLRGDREAILLLALNRSARLSRSSFNALAAMAQSNTAMRDALIRRSDLPGRVVEKLWPSLDGDLRARLIASGWRYSMAEIEEIGREASAGLPQEVGAGPLPRSLDAYRTLVETEAVPLSDALAELIKAGRLVEAGQLIARVRGMPEGVALNLLCGAYERGAAVLARHLALKDEAVLLLACARSRLPRVASTEIRHALALTDEISKSEAEALIAAMEKLWASGIANTGERRRFRPAA